MPDAEYAGLPVIQARRTVQTRADTADFVFKVDQVQCDTVKDRAWTRCTKNTRCG